MSAREIFELRQNGRAEEAYEAARRLYATDKSAYASSAMFWTAVDILRMRVDEGRIEEASKILMAIERLLPRVNDEKGWVRKAYGSSVRLLQEAQARTAGAKEQAGHSQMGIWGEEVAADYLREKGYVILERDWHSGHRDIDIIARQGDTTVFVEVKTRSNADYMLPEEAVGYKKLGNLRIAISHYVKFRKIDTPIRFDIITVVGAFCCDNPVVSHIENVNLT